jgi:iron only hydrogenase large subunit-like protein
LDLIQNSWNNTSYHVYAIVAPAIASQFPEVKTGQVFAAVKELGFYDVIEAAIGGDMVAVQEAREFAETIDEKGWKTTSCCPAFVDYVQRNYPEFMDHVSTTVSPMIALARAIHEKDKKARVVFIGPCVAKKVEIKHEDLIGAVDYVLTFEELKATFDAKEIDLEEFEERSAGAPSYFGRIFGRTGGVAQSVVKVAEMEGIEKEIKPIYCNGIEECIKNMKLASFGRLNANLLEGMACKNGCTGGAASLSHDQKGIELLNRYGKEATTQSPFEGMTGYDLDVINMEREFGLEEK